MITIAYGQHRSADLADRHARQIERDENLLPGSVNWKRRNAKGRFSNRGHFFEFFKEEGIREYTFRAKYDGKAQRGGKHPVNMEMHFFAPSGLKLKPALDAIEHWALMGDLPDRWKPPVAIEWNGKVYERQIDLENLRFALYKIFEGADIEILDTKKDRDLE